MRDGTTIGGAEQYRLLLLIEQLQREGKTEAEIANAVRDMTRDRGQLPCPSIRRRRQSQQIERERNDHFHRRLIRWQALLIRRFVPQRSRPKRRRGLVNRAPTADHV